MDPNKFSGKPDEMLGGNLALDKTFFDHFYVTSREQAQRIKLSCFLLTYIMYNPYHSFGSKLFNFSNLLWDQECS